MCYWQGQMGSRWRLAVGVRFFHWWSVSQWVRMRPVQTHLALYWFRTATEVGDVCDV